MQSALSGRLTSACRFCSSGGIGRSNTSASAPFKPPYCSFDALWRALGYLSAWRPLPQQLKPSHLGVCDGGAKTIFAALRSLGLIDATNAPTAELEDLVASHPNTTVLRALLEVNYKRVIAVDLATATQGQMEEVLKAMGTTPSKVGPARRFFQRACEMSGIEVGAPLRSTSSKRGRRRSPAPKRSELVQSVIDRVPREGEFWPEDERRRWLDIARLVFADAYSPPTNHRVERPAVRGRP